jgi:hypothetical protein
MATGNFIEVASSANDGPWGTGESFASNCAHSRGGISEALLFEKMQQLWREMLLLRILRKILPIELTWHSQGQSDLRRRSTYRGLPMAEKTKSPLSVERASVF